MKQEEGGGRRRRRNRPTKDPIFPCKVNNYKKVATSMSFYCF